MFSLGLSMMAMRSRRRPPVPDPYFPPASTVKVADENGSFTVTSPTTVWYGSNTDGNWPGGWAHLTFPAGTYVCGNDAFGGSDPAERLAKTCRLTPPPAQSANRTLTDDSSNPLTDNTSNTLTE